MVGLSACDGAVDPADLVIRGAHVVTMEGRRVEALAVQGDRIAALGSDEEIGRLIGEETTVLDLDGALVLPGFIESHAHFLSLGRGLAQLDLQDLRTFREVVDAVALEAGSVAPGQWIFGRGWHQSKWTDVPADAVEGLPSHRDLSAATPDNPVLLTHASGHAAFANATAMELAGIDASTPDPEDGEIVRDANGTPIGVFREGAQALLFRVARGQRGAETAASRWVDLATQESLRHGVTSFHDAGSSVEEIDFLADFADRGELGIRLWVMVRDSREALETHLPRLRRVEKGGFFTVRAIKESIDGALGTHGAWLLEPYADLPSSSGIANLTIDALQVTADLAVRHDYQLCVHAIGDRGNRETLDVFERTFAGDAERDWRWRIEHAQHLHPDDIGRFAELGVIASVQGVHCTSDGPWVPDRLGERRSAEGAYRWRDLLDSGAVVVNGTDAPVERIDPLASIYASVTRRLPDGTSFSPEQRMTIEEALRSYTRDAAYAAFEEDEKGTLAQGKLADLVVLSRDLLSVEPSEILTTHVLYTIVGGRVAYRADG